MNVLLEELERMSDERFLAIYEALSERGLGPLDNQVAQALKFRPHAIRKLTLEQRARRARKLIAGPRNTELAYELFGTYLVRTRRDLVTGFLDATGVPHEEGMIEDVDAAPPDAKKIEAAVEELDGKHDPEDVTLYLALCTQMWDGVQELGAVYRARTGG